MNEKKLEELKKLIHKRNPANIAGLSSLSKKEVKSYINRVGDFAKAKLERPEKSDLTIPAGAMYIEGILSDETKNSNGYVISLDARQDGFKKYLEFYNGLIYESHNMEVSIGKTIEIGVNGNSLVAKGYIFDDLTGNRVSRGLLNDISTGHIPLEIEYRNSKTKEALTYNEFWSKIRDLYEKDNEEEIQAMFKDFVEYHTKVQIVEFSLVGVGANEQAQITRTNTIGDIKNSMEELKNNMEEEEKEEELDNIEEKEVKKKESGEEKMSVEEGVSEELQKEATKEESTKEKEEEPKKESGDDKEQEVDQEEQEAEEEKEGEGEAQIEAEGEADEAETVEAQSEKEQEAEAKSDDDEKINTLDKEKENNITESDGENPTAENAELKMQKEEIKILAEKVESLENELLEAKKLLKYQDSKKKISSVNGTTQNNDMMKFVRNGMRKARKI